MIKCNTKAMVVCSSEEAPEKKAKTEVATNGGSDPPAPAPPEPPPVSAYSNSYPGWGSYPVSQDSRNQQFRPNSWVVLVAIAQGAFFLGREGQLGREREGAVGTGRGKSCVGGEGASLVRKGKAERVG